jgi:exopolyphosphatase/guanosine-5'-triphosphate,3'-diphosphate pyrophosphatase
MIVASIDIGTNTVLLLIAEVESAQNLFTPLLNEYRMPRIGKGLSFGESISDEKIDELLSVITEYDKIIKDYNCKEVIISATNAFRIASNANAIINLIKEILGYNVNVITGEEEAEYGFLGATSGMSNFSSALVIDIGGGSTEIIYGERKKMKFRKSFQIGSVSGTENYLINSPPTLEEANNLRNEIHQIFTELENKFVPDVSIAIAGTPTTLACMKQDLKEYDDLHVEGSYLSANDMHSLINDLIKLNSYKIRERYGKVMQGREDIILAGAIILSELMKLMNLDEVRVSSRGIRYGAVAKYIKRIT